MTVTRIQPSATYVQDELRRIQDTLASAIDQGVRQERTIYAGAYGASAVTVTTWYNFYTTYSGNNLFGGWVADKAGSVIAVSVYDTATANNQQYAVAINNVPPNYIITRGAGVTSVATYPVGQLTFKQGDLIQLWVRNQTTASTTFAATGHITVSMGA